MAFPVPNHSPRSCIRISEELPAVPFELGYHVPLRRPRREVPTTTMIRRSLENSAQRCLALHLGTSTGDAIWPPQHCECQCVTFHCVPSLPTFTYGLRSIYDLARAILRASIVCCCTCKRPLLAGPRTHHANHGAQGSMPWTFNRPVW